MSEERVSQAQKSKIQSAASAALSNFPGQERLATLKNEALRAFLQEVQALLVDAQHATDWNDQQARDYAVRTGAYVTAYSAAVSPRDAACTDGCSRTRNDCINRECGPNTSWPCFCCVPCNTAWLACLASCVAH